MEDFLILLIKIVVFGVVLFVLPMIVAKTFLAKSVDKRALGVVMAVLFGLAILSVTIDLANLLTQPIIDHSNGGSVQQFGPSTRTFRTGPLNLDIR